MSAERILSPAEQTLLKEYLAALTAEGITWMVLRNFQDFPERIGHDLDLFVPRSDLDRATAVFHRLLGAAGGRIFITHERDYFRDIRFTIGQDAGQALTLDLYHGAYTWHGLPYLSDADLIAGARMSGELRVPRKAHEALGLVLASLLWGAFFKSRYQARIAELLAAPGEREEFNRCLHRAFGAAAALSFDPAVEAGREPEHVKSDAARVRRDLRVTQFRRAPLSTLSRMVAYWRSELRTILRPRGLVVAVLGPDGSGKSTVLAGVERRLGGLFGEVHRYHWRPGILPEIGVLLGCRDVQIGPVAAPHGKSPHSTPVSLLRLAYYLADYWLGYLPRVLKRKAQVHLVLFDRYAADVWCDPRRYRLHLPQSFLRFLCAFVPAPDFTFVLLTDPSTLMQRKSEVSLEAAEFLLKQYRRFAETGRRCFAVDASEPADKVIEQIADRIAAFLLHREHHHEA